MRVIVPPLAVHEIQTVKLLDADGATFGQRMIDVHNDLKGIAVVEQGKETRILRLVSNDTYIQIKFEQPIQNI